MRAWPFLLIGILSYQFGFALDPKELDCIKSAAHVATNPNSATTHEKPRFLILEHRDHFAGFDVFDSARPPKSGASRESIRPKGHAKSFSVTDVRWRGQAPNEDAYRGLLAVDDEIPIFKGDRLTHLDYNHFINALNSNIESEGGRIFFNDPHGLKRIEILKNGTYEEDLIAASLQAKNAGTEYLGVRVTTKEGSTFEVPFCDVYECGGLGEPRRFKFGRPNQVSLARSKIDTLISNMEAQGIHIDTIDISHTHSASQVRNETKGVTLVAPFNEIDLAGIEGLSLGHTQYRFRGRAITPDGFNYSVSVRNGQRID